MPLIEVEDAAGVGVRVVGEDPNPNKSAKGSSERFPLGFIFFPRRAKAQQEAIHNNSTNLNCTGHDVCFGYLEGFSVCNFELGKGNEHVD
jgi:hypothetical protein